MAPDNIVSREGEAFATLARLLADHGRGAAMYGSGFSMHLPMVLIALFRMGATSATLDAAAASSARIPEARPEATRPIDAASWERELGKQRTFVPYRTLFAAELERAPIAAVLSRFLPRLLEGMAAAGFHALIRLSYGLDLGSRDEIATGLAYLASAFDPLDIADTRGEPSSRSIPEALAAAQAFGTVAKAPSGRISEAIRSGMGTPAYAAGAAIDEGQLSLRTLAGAALQTYVAKPSIYTLHLVTAAHALKIVDDQFTIERPLLRIFWRCVLAMHVAVGAGAPSDAAVRASEVDDWSSLFAAAIAETDDHAIKFTYSCSVLARAFDDERFRIAAARMLHGRQASKVGAH
jgi:Questin oxidase-like